MYDRLNSVEELPEGWTDEQDAGRYRLRQRSDKALFAFVTGPQSWKQYLFPPEERLWSTRKKNGRLNIIDETPAPKKQAFIGVRSCELHAIAIQDKVFLEGV